MYFGKHRFAIFLTLPTPVLVSFPQETHLRSCRSNHRPIAPTGAGEFSTREVGRRPGHPAGPGHRG